MGIAESVEIGDLDHRRRVSLENGLQVAKARTGRIDLPLPGESTQLVRVPQAARRQSVRASFLDRDRLRRRRAILDLHFSINHKGVKSAQRLNHLLSEGSAGQS